MKIKILFLSFLWLTPFSFAAGQQKSKSPDPLPSWNTGAARKAITDFVTKTTKKGSPGFIPVNDRIACFDNDGTLWAEQPLPFQFYFAIDRIKAMAPQHPEWKTTQPFQALLEGDVKTALAGGQKAALEIMMTTHAGMTTEEFAQVVKDWMTTAVHPVTRKHYNEMIYQPMVELLNYLRVNGYKTFIVSGGGIDFMRVWAEAAYGIPPYQVIGSSGKMKYEIRDGVPVILKLPEVNFIDDKEGKPVAIQEHIGQRPVFAAGNSDGDYAMMQWTTTAESFPRFGLLVHHTDHEREFAYDITPLSHLEKGLADAAQNHWLVVDMKKDWNMIYPKVLHTELTAIDILLDPDQIMMDSAKARNAIMRDQFAAGFALDADHAPHITIIQQYVRTKDLNKVYAAVDEVVKNSNLQREKMTATGLYYIPFKDLGLAGITVKTTQGLLQFQSALLKAIAPFTVKTGSASAFVPKPDGTAITKPTVDYVNVFVPEHSGDHYNPHVTIGIAPESFVRQMMAQKFIPFEFKVQSVSIYQLGDLGTAQRKLWSSLK